MKRSDSPQNKTHSNDGVPSEKTESYYNIYSEKPCSVGIGKIIFARGNGFPSEKNNKLEKKFYTNLSVGICKPISAGVLAKALGYALGQVYSLIGRGAIKSRNGLIPAEEAERLLHPKIQKI